jgi:hypothetical protein
VGRDITAPSISWDDGENDWAMREQHRASVLPRRFDADPVSLERFQYPLPGGKHA